MRVRGTVARGGLPLLAVAHLNVLQMSILIEIGMISVLHENISEVRTLRRALPINYFGKHHSYKRQVRALPPLTA